MGRTRKHEDTAGWLVAAFFLLALGLWIGTLSAAPRDPIFAKYEIFRLSVVSWINFKDELSPSSLDWRERLAERYHEDEVGRKFREWESSVTDTIDLKGDSQ